MSLHLRVSIAPQLDARITREARSIGVSKSAWIRRVLEEALERDKNDLSPIERHASLNAPTADIERMLVETEAGRG